MGTFVVGSALTVVVVLIIRSMIRDKKMESRCSAAVTVPGAEGAIKWAAWEMGS